MCCNPLRMGMISSRHDVLSRTSRTGGQSNRRWGSKAIRIGHSLEDSSLRTRKTMRAYTRLEPRSSSAMMVLADKTFPKEGYDGSSRGDPVQRSLARQRVLLSRRVKAYYDLIRASPFHSATYGFPLEPSNPRGWEERGSPIYSACLFVRAIPRTPVDRPAASGCCFTDHISLRHLRHGSASTTPRQLVHAWSV